MVDSEELKFLFVIISLILVVFITGSLQHDFVSAALLLSCTVLITVSVPVGIADSCMLLHMAAGRYQGRKKAYCIYSATPIFSFVSPLPSPNPSPFFVPIFALKGCCFYTGKNVLDNNSA